MMTQQPFYGAEASWMCPKLGEVKSGIFTAGSLQKTYWKLGVFSAERFYLCRI